MATAWFASALFFTSTMALGSECFETFASLGFDAWFTSFGSIMLVFLLLSLGALLVAAMAMWVSWQESQVLLRIFIVSAAVLSMILFVLALISWRYGIRARPALFREANLICQDVRVWGCIRNDEDERALPGTEADLQHGGRRLAGDLASLVVREARIRWLSPTLHHFGALVLYHSWHLPAAATLVLRTVFSSDDALHGEAAEVHLRGGQDHSTDNGRRLDAAKAALRFARRFDQISVEAGGAASNGTRQTEVCQRLDRLCTPPADFDPNTACVCSSVWDFADAGDSKAAHSDKAGRRLANDGLGPWKDTVGAYCNAWDKARGSWKHWCFVSAAQKCHQEMRLPKACSSQQTCHGAPGSSGPCTPAVESRSQCVLDGLALTKPPNRHATALSIVLLLAATVGIVAPQLNDILDGKGLTLDATASEASKPKASREDSRQLEKRFKDAQQEVVHKLKESTPAEKRFQLFGFYKQATEGDVQDELGALNSNKERRKYEAWYRHRGMSKEEAMEKYIAAVALLD